VADGASYETPVFGWTGEGRYDPATGEGALAFAGSVRSTGHGGILDTTIANPQVRLIDSGRGMLLLDVTGTTQDGVAVSDGAVEVAERDPNAATVADRDGLVRIDGVAATLTEDGAAAF